MISCHFLRHFSSPLALHWYGWEGRLEKDRRSLTLRIIFPLSDENGFHFIRGLKKEIEPMGREKRPPFFLIHPSFLRWGAPCATALRKETERKR